MPPATVIAPTAVQQATPAPMAQQPISATQPALLKHNIPLELGYLAVIHTMDDVDARQNIVKQKTQARNAERAKNAHEGWQLKVCVNIQNDKANKQLQQALQDIIELDNSIAYKINESNTLADRKEYIVRIGSLKDSKRVAAILEGAVSELLPLDIIERSSSVVLSPRGYIWGSFDVMRTQPIVEGEPYRLVAKNVSGVPMMTYHAAVPGITASKIVSETSDLLKNLYGTYFDDGTLVALQSAQTGS